MQATQVRQWLLRGLALVRSQEMWLLLPILLIGGALWLFAELTDDVLEGDTHAFDRAVLLALREPGDTGTPIGPPWLIRKRAAALLVAVSVAGGALLSSILKYGFNRTRPDVVPHAVEIYSASFPSGHAMLSTVTYLTLGALLARVQSSRRVKVYLLAWAVFLSALVGLSRIYLGVHWPTDVVAGWCVGAAWALFSASVALWLQRRGTVETSAPVPQ